MRLISFWMESFVEAGKEGMLRNRLMRAFEEQVSITKRTLDLAGAVNLGWPARDRERPQLARSWAVPARGDKVSWGRIVANGEKQKFIFGACGLGELFPVSCCAGPLWVGAPFQSAWSASGAQQPPDGWLPVL